MAILLLISSVLFAEKLENASIPKDTQSDWMELKSGEWLRGEFKGVYSGTVEFDSEEFDLVKFDTDDVQQIVTKGVSTISLNKKMPKLKPLHLLKKSDTEKNSREVIQRKTVEK